MSLCENTGLRRPDFGVTLATHDLDETVSQAEPRR
jgi:hypothetical protein